MLGQYLSVDVSSCDALKDCRAIVSGKPQFFKLDVKLCFVRTSDFFY